MEPKTHVKKYFLSSAARKECEIHGIQPFSCRNGAQIPCGKHSLSSAARKEYVKFMRSNRSHKNGCNPVFDEFFCFPNFGSVCREAQCTAHARSNFLGERVPLQFGPF
jgi:hypothetical protein